MDIVHYPCRHCCGLQENGWVTFPLLGLLLWGSGKWKETPRFFIAGALTCAMILLLVRLDCGSAVFYGYQFGNNRSWFTRYCIAIMSPYPSMFLKITCAPAILGTSTYFAFCNSKVTAIRGAVITNWGRFWLSGILKRHVTRTL